MPPPQNSLASESVRNAAGPGLDLAIALQDGELAAVRAGASIAAPVGGAATEHAAGPAAASTWWIARTVRRCWRVFRNRRRSLVSRGSLHELSDRELMDIGLTRAELDSLAPHRAVDALRDGPTYRWIMFRGGA